MTPFSDRNSVSCSAIRLVSVVTSTRSPACTRMLISDSRSSTWVVAGRTMMIGSTRPVGRTTCSTTCPAWSFSNCAGVAETNITWRILRSNSSNFSGRLSSADGIRKPYSTSVVLRARSPLYMPLSWPISTCDSSRNISASGGR
ncbi:hypothetical protein D3C72_1270590 [compost metagenome]